jgi:hypothetical protein
MSELETHECTVCGASFAAYPDANAAQSGYCSPSCALEGKGLR